MNLLKIVNIRRILFQSEQLDKNKPKLRHYVETNLDNIYSWERQQSKGKYEYIVFKHVIHENVVGGNQILYLQDNIFK